MSANKTREIVILEISVLSSTKGILEKILQTSEENLMEEKNKKMGRVGLGVCLQKELVYEN